ncbi:hypothetical protein QGN32_17645 [Mycolicibacterium sp. ND9-15]|uniref:hypothetical protein n=1 Tax=Mycolicibacterium sp. ND9-15 TaxID=3042320 RepID=UPI002DDBD89F|nr:hypothetical protein [Mycolicibacterium sp. ND9-15]WSE55254.1 hypothetical protein QGN32_17645 [Mycolicibacterium sp. ND9-15]
MHLDEAPATVADAEIALVTTAASQPALGTGLAVLGLVSLLHLIRSSRHRQGFRCATDR